MQFQFATATKIVFGAGTINEAVSFAQGCGKKALVLTGRSKKRAEPLLERLSEQKIEHVTFSVGSEPTTETVANALAEAKKLAPDSVIGFGGGSVIDTGKVVAALLTNEGELFDYLEVIGKGQKIQKSPLPYVAIPTTAGTGAEVTRNGVVASPEHGVKVSMRSPLMLPACAIIDPELTYSMPPSVTASTGLDALTQCLEPYVSNKANPMTDAFCKEGLLRAGRSLRKAYDNPEDSQAREDMAMASLFGGLALANAKLGAVHGFAGPLGGHLRAPHGVVCAAMLPLVFSANVAAINLLGDEKKELLNRFDEVAQLLTGDQEANANIAVQWLDSLCAHLAVPKLASIGLQDSDIEMLAEKASRSSSMKGNPVVFSKGELATMLRKAM